MKTPWPFSWTYVLPYLHSWELVLIGRPHGTSAAAVALVLAVFAKLGLQLIWMRVLKVCVQTYRGLAILFSASFCSFLSIFIALLFLDGGRDTFEIRFSVLAFLRLIDIFVFTGVAVHSFREGERRQALHAEVRARVSRLCTLEDLKKHGAAEQTDLSHLSCCACLFEFRPQEEIALFRCFHVAHGLCAQNLFSRHLTGRTQRSLCPMNC
eukprot:TRINITY_DN23941_c0_g1_i1.p1 TRINITY_DN23941_c0_g1~~TRINITY_DN23941_c0_g1_i1.p1  ORF type:complete len:210 (+),score=20.33 TRINITY_DN23941_c0_g1_i1:40-669(+)